MEHIKALTLVVLTIMILSNCSGKQDRADLNVRALSIDKDLESDNAILLLNYQYDVILDTLGVLRLKVLSEDLMNLILETTNPTIFVELEGERIIAKGNLFLSSFIPEKCDYFFSIDEKGKIITYSGELSLSKIE